MRARDSPPKRGCAKNAPKQAAGALHSAWMQSKTTPFRSRTTLGEAYTGPPVSLASLERVGAVPSLAFPPPPRAPLAAAHSRMVRCPPCARSLDTFFRQAPRKKFKAGGSSASGGGGGGGSGGGGGTKRETSKRGQPKGRRSIDTATQNQAERFGAASLYFPSRVGLGREPSRSLLGSGGLGLRIPRVPNRACSRYGAAWRGRHGGSVPVARATAVFPPRVRAVCCCRRRLRSEHGEA